MKPVSGFRVVPCERASVHPGGEFERLVVLGWPFYIQNSRQLVVCECLCGSVVCVRVEHLIDGTTRSCGCLKNEVAARPKIHGGTNTRLYRIWSNMRQRCENPKNTKYRSYGEKGIAVCESWKSFANFQDWSMTNGYKSHLSIDRKDGSLGYSPENCRWATCSQQGMNKPPGKSDTGFKGVARNGKRWSATIAVNGIHHYLGTYATPEIAANEYNKAALILHGEFANLNVIQ